MRLGVVRRPLEVEVEQRIRDFGIVVVLDSRLVKLAVRQSHQGRGDYLVRVVHLDVEQQITQRTRSFREATGYTDRAECLRTSWRRRRPSYQESVDFGPNPSVSLAARMVRI